MQIDFVLMLDRRSPKVEISVLHFVHLHPLAILPVDLVVGGADAGELAQGDVIRPGGQALLLRLHHGMMLSQATIPAWLF